MDKERKLVLTRHLATQFNRDGKLMGRTIDLPIIKDLQVQIFTQNLDRLVKDYDINPQKTVIISSPLQRCKETAEIIKSTLEIPSPILIFDLITETDLGDFTGYKSSSLRNKFNGLVDQWMHNPSTFQFPNGESYEEVKTRVTKFLDSIQNVPNIATISNIFICTHVDFIKMLLLTIQNKSFDERRSFDIKNGSFSVITTGANSDQSVKYKILSTNFR
ncbi:MAG TPA: histidine phosphatase family protein [Candidatus Saccharimonadales bacterium]|nr:histidine phosphatase family protein [Candidatus Saccharimonadales bacterium]